MLTLKAIPTMKRLYLVTRLPLSFLGSQISINGQESLNMEESP